MFFKCNWCRKKKYIEFFFGLFLMKLNFGYIVIDNIEL